MSSLQSPISNLPKLKQFSKLQRVWPSFWVIANSWAGFFFLLLPAANWFLKERERSRNELIELGAKLLYHSLAAFLRVVENARQSRGSLAPWSLMEVL